MVPATLPGRLFSSVCAVIGILVIAMPIPIIANNFTEFYSNQRKQEKLVQYKNEREKSDEAIHQDVEELLVSEPLLNKSVDEPLKFKFWILRFFSCIDYRLLNTILILNYI